ncbi:MULTISPECIES: hypothetical protein [Streptosporangium]|uniref:Uncharacterized protein n=1 Tax=Streptosporangium brasiliense TaxID=47480 RepID=A0ABT9QVX4_9ACTN|nr:hypothetical protein [Streptosporangium brasiliense]MDP9861129.1 hypothetical protein [Streptosporangium brasiliense]
MNQVRGETSVVRGDGHGGDGAVDDDHPPGGKVEGAVAVDPPVRLVVAVGPLGSGVVARAFRR